MPVKLIKSSFSSTLTPTLTITGGTHSSVVFTKETLFEVWGQWKVSRGLFNYNGDKRTKNCVIKMDKWKMDRWKLWVKSKGISEWDSFCFWSLLPVRLPHTPSPPLTIFVSGCRLCFATTLQMSSTTWTKNPLLIFYPKRDDNISK